MTVECGICRAEGVWQLHDGDMSLSWAPSSPSGADDVEALVLDYGRACMEQDGEHLDSTRTALLAAIRDRGQRARDPDARVKKGFRIGIESAARCVENFGGAAACDLAAEIRALSEREEG